MPANQTTLPLEDTEYNLNTPVNTSIQFVFTKPFREATHVEYRDKLKSMFLESLKEFSELNPKTIRIGGTWCTRATANNFQYTTPEDPISISINPTQSIRYRVLGHELTHFIQRLKLIPGGEKACDIYSMARSPLFLDIPPTYLQLPALVCKNWNRRAHMVRQICIQAIEKRNTIKQYIKWCENEIDNYDFE